MRGRGFQSFSSWPEKFKQITASKRFCVFKRKVFTLEIQKKCQAYETFDYYNLTHNTKKKNSNNLNNNTKTTKGE